MTSTNRSPDDTPGRFYAFFEDLMPFICTMLSPLFFLVLTGAVSGTPWWFDDTDKTTTSTDDAYIELQTGPNKNYIPLQEMGMEVTTIGSFMFQVRAARDVHVVLQKHAGETKRYVYEITLGGWANTMSVVRKAVTNGRIMTEHRHSPLNRTDFRPFWITWKKGYVTVGSGERIGINMFMTYRDPFPHPVSYISVSTGWAVTGTWRFASPIPVIGLWTNPQESLQFQSLGYRGYDVQDKDNVSFWIKGSNDAHVVLRGDTLPYTNMYWVSLGALRNTLSFVRKGRMGPDLAQALHNPLSRGHYLPFWISWEGGVVSAGEGTDIGRRQFMAWTDHRPFEVTNMYVSTGQGSSGHWLINLDNDQFTRQLPKTNNGILLHV